MLIVAGADLSTPSAATGMVAAVCIDSGDQRQLGFTQQTLS